MDSPYQVAADDSRHMQLKLTTWNINSVRLRIDLVAKFIKAVRPDVLCLQEIKCVRRRVSAQALQAARL